MDGVLSRITPMVDAQAQKIHPEFRDTKDNTQGTETE